MHLRLLSSVEEPGYFYVSSFTRFTALVTTYEEDLEVSGGGFGSDSFSATVKLPATVELLAVDKAPLIDGRLTRGVGLCFASG